MGVLVFFLDRSNEARLSIDLCVGLKKKGCHQSYTTYVYEDLIAKIGYLGHFFFSKKKRGGKVIMKGS